MFTVSISYNGQPLYARSVRRQNRVEIGEIATYKTDAGDIIKFRYGDPIIELAKLVLDTIKKENQV